MSTSVVSEEPKKVAMQGPAFAARIQAVDQDALQEVVRAFMGQILRAARGSGLSPEKADDVTQATFATFIEVAPRFEGRSHVRTFLFGILYKKIAEARREQKRERQMESIEDVVEERFSSDEHWQRPPRAIDLQLQDSEIGQVIDGCLEDVSTQQRLAFALREVLGFTTDEICDVLDVTRTNLGVLLFRARNRLRECLETKGVGEKG